MRWKLLLAVLLAFSSQAQAAGKLVYAVSELPPWKTYTGTGVEGPDVVIMEKIANEMGLQLEVIKAPLARCIAMLEEGSADVVSSVSPDPDREKSIQFLPTKYKGPNRKVFYVKKGSGVAVKSYDDLLRYRIGAKTGANYFQPFDEDARLKLDRVSDESANIKKLLAGRVDCFIANEPVGDYLIRKEGVAGQIEKAEFVHETAATGQIGLSKKSKLFSRASEMDAILSKLVKSGEAAKIIKKGLQ